MERIQEKRLIKWYKSRRPKPLIIRGARQIGKSTLVRQFSQANQLKLYEVNLENHRILNSIFESLDIDLIVRSLESIIKEKILAQNSLLFLDEIQATPAALQALRYFYESKTFNVPIVAAGSLLEFTLSDFKYSMPVGRIEFLHMGPMTFEEFLQALDEHILIEKLQTYHLSDQIDAITHQQLLDLLRQFMLVGGMPEAILNYRETKDFYAVKTIQQSIINAFHGDFYKYRDKINDNIIRIIEQVFHTIPNHIGHKLIYSHINPSEKSQAIKSAIEMLTKARLVHCVYATAASGLPLKAQINRKVYKPLFLDIGLANRMFGLDWQALSKYDENELINKGVLAEQFIGQMLAFPEDGLESPELYYWQRTEKGSEAEIDFVFSSGNLIIPTEVKAGKTGRMKSLFELLAAKKLKFAVRFDANTPSFFQAQGNVTSKQHKTYNFKLLSLPLYLVGQLKRLIIEVREQ